VEESGARRKGRRRRRRGRCIVWGFFGGETWARRGDLELYIYTHGKLLRIGPERGYVLNKMERSSRGSLMDEADILRISLSLTLERGRLPLSL
jgi:hypothetical protein